MSIKRNYTTFARYVENIGHLPYLTTNNTNLYLYSPTLGRYLTLQDLYTIPWSIQANNLDQWVGTAINDWHVLQRGWKSCEINVGFNNGSANARTYLVFIVNLDAGWTNYATGKVIVQGTFGTSSGTLTLSATPDTTTGTMSAVVVAQTHNYSWKVEDDGITIRAV